MAWDLLLVLKSIFWITTPEGMPHKKAVNRTQTYNIYNEQHILHTYSPWYSTTLVAHNIYLLCKWRVCTPVRLRDKLIDGAVILIDASARSYSSTRKCTVTNILTHSVIQHDSQCDRCMITTEQMTSSCVYKRQGPMVGKTVQFHPQITLTFYAPIEKRHNQWIEYKYR